MACISHSGTLSCLTSSLHFVQADSVKEIADFVAQLRRVGKGLGVYEFDKMLAGKAAEMYATLPSPLGEAA